jgi:outer membrane lipoprotein carrier protein
MLAQEAFNIKTFEAYFKQTVLNSSDKEIVYEGKVFIKEPSKILWQYESPVIKNVYVIANTVVVDEPELEQAIYTRLENEINLLKLIKKSVKKTDNLYETTIGDTKYEIVLNNNQIQRIVYLDELENKVTIDFMKVKQNKSISDTLFQFTPPSFYDVIKK